MTDFPIFIMNIEIPNRRNKKKDKKKEKKGYPYRNNFKIKGEEYDRRKEEKKEKEIEDIILNLLPKGYFS